MDEKLRQQVGKLFHKRWGKLGLEGLLPEERDHVLLWCLHAEWTTGGFHAYLFNSAGAEHAEETVAALNRHGMKETAKVLKRVLKLLPGGWCADSKERARRLEKVRFEDLEALDREYDKSIAATPQNDSLSEAILKAYRREGLLDVQPVKRVPTKKSREAAKQSRKPANKSGQSAKTSRTPAKKRRRQGK